MSHSDIDAHYKVVREAREKADVVWADIGAGLRTIRRVGTSDLAACREANIAAKDAAAELTTHLYTISMNLRAIDAIINPKVIDTRDDFGRVLRGDT